MKIYEIGKDTERRLKLLDGEIGSVQENVYLFVCNDNGDIALMWEYVSGAVARGIEVFRGATSDLIVKVSVEKDGATTVKSPVFTFVAGNTKDDVWVRDVIKIILKDEERHNEEKERRYGDGTSHSG